MLKVNEIFKSIQGESSYTGYPCTFIRLGGCNLRCKYCDTKYAYDYRTVLSVGEVLKIVESEKCKLVEVTGGEPLMQEETPELIRALVNANYKVLLETNGSYSFEDIQDINFAAIVDYKCPGSITNVHYQFRADDLRNTDELKFVLSSRGDYEWAKKTARGFGCMKINFSPVWGVLEPSDLAKWILEDSLNVRLQVQLHKIIWPETKRGV